MLGERLHESHFVIFIQTYSTSPRVIICLKVTGLTFIIKVLDYFFIFETDHCYRLLK